MDKKTFDNLLETDPRKLVAILSQELTRVYQLCHDNNIDTSPPPLGASIGVKAEIKVFKTKKEAEENLKSNS